METHFSVKYPCRARLCLRLFFHFLQTSLHPAKEHPQTALSGPSLQKSKTMKTVASTITITKMMTITLIALRAFTNNVRDFRHDSALLMRASHCSHCFRNSRFRFHVSRFYIFSSSIFVSLGGAYSK